ncbi:MAG: T9SS type B sorting domain-containing protein [Bacteroidetes bacterium]|nr:T9SS type B sorting domain-containing protein [Bacteroidota bacterium]
MLKYIVCILCLVGEVAFSQECPDLLSPVNGQSEVPVTATISWEAVVGVTGYIVSIGTSPNADDVVSNQPTGSETSFTPPLGLPESTELFVTITLFFFDQDDIICESKTFTTQEVIDRPVCTQLTAPIDGAMNVNAATNLNWAYASLAVGYQLTIGTAPGVGDIILNEDVGNRLSFNPTADFPLGATIFVRIEPYNENGSALSCEEEQFTVASLGDPPGCSQLITPTDGDVNVALSPLIEWQAVPNALGYLVYIGRSPFVNDVLDGAIFTTNSTFVLNFEANTSYFIRVVPFNDAGEAQGCSQESFSTILGCGPFIDPETGEVVTLNPEINFPDVVGICENSLPTRISTVDLADGFRWYAIDVLGDETLISEASFVDIEATGAYRYEAYTLIDQEGVVIECPSSKEFVVVASASATVEQVLVEKVVDLFNVTIVVSGIGSYEFSLEDVDGSYGDENVFNNLPAGSYTAYIRDKNGCGVVEAPFRLALRPPGFPKFFSPNADGINDLWQYQPPRENALNLRYIFIHDRMGKLIIIIKPDSQGWNGLYNGNPLPSSEYWYRAIDYDQREYLGHFSLIR